MNTIILIIVLQVIVISLTGCSAFEEKLHQQEVEQQQLNCSPPHDRLCVGWMI